MAVIVAGFVVVSGSVYQLLVRPVGTQWFLLVGLTLISGSATVKLPSVPASISISETFVFAAVLLYGPAAGTLTVALDGLVISYWIAKRRKEPYRALFNMSAPALSAWCSAHLFFRLAGIRPLVEAPATVDRILPALLVFALCYFWLNSWLITIAISLETRLAAVAVWRQNFIWLSLNYFCGASVALLLVVYTREIDIRFVAVIVPLLLVLYITFKTSMDRVEDANRHVEKVDRLYISTIETLAMAVDAKDQITHGHIRRVQRYAVGLARELGVRDESLLRAIEAAALLHDMGKLAVPEYILNKPGRLTAAEFEKMKLHASVGADILSAIEFPYPVIPIVRHHHEAWDGSGYPDRIKGTEIPIGARILAVVDCFDALTSDRPYRPKLSHTEALAILRERKGTMYDPWVVQTFEKVYRLLEQDAQEAISQKPGALAELTTASAAARRSEKDHHPFSPTKPSLDPELVGLITAEAHRRTSASVTVFYSYDLGSTDLVARHVIGNLSDKLLNSRIAFGQRVTGWVAANLQAMINSDAALDLPELAPFCSPPLKSCLSTPVLVSDHFVGVLTAYTAKSSAFSTELLSDVRHMISEALATTAQPQ
jgi:putative nucleotidyltransferase with HDIG domain